jgi:hypothetical protein
MITQEKKTNQKGGTREKICSVVECEKEYKEKDKERRRC